MVFTYFQVAAAMKKKAIQILTVTEEKIIPMKEISLPEPAVTLVSLCPFDHC